ncbi:MAG: hypothetical protein ACU837_03385 [Gammaproteobacteria bacterium]
MPINTRIDMLTTGIKTPLGIKISAYRPEVIEGIGCDIESALQQVAGTCSVLAERYIEIIIAIGHAVFPQVKAVFP